MESNIQGNKDLYSYGGTVSTLAVVGNIQTFNVQIEADANFYAVKFNYFASIGAALQTDSTRVLPLVRLQINDQSAGRNLFNTSIALPVFAGFGSLPGIIPINRWFRSNSTVTLTFTSYTAAAAYDIDFAFIGVKQYGG